LLIVSLIALLGMRHMSYVLKINPYFYTETELGTLRPYNNDSTRPIIGVT